MIYRLSLRPDSCVDPCTHNTVATVQATYSYVCRHTLCICQLDSLYIHTPVNPHTGLTRNINAWDLSHTHSVLSDDLTLVLQGRKTQLEWGLYLHLDHPTIDINTDSYTSPYWPTALCIATHFINKLKRSNSVRVCVSVFQPNYLIFFISTCQVTSLSSPSLSIWCLS